ncbi:MAG: deoxynucleoside kinase [Deltaproteobacteria bacterium]|nr:MAG: deoxynucleoside kinase [Deltaproteobacteria bacterium]
MSKRPSYSYIAVEGPLGVGKTSLASLLSERLKGVAVLEKTEDNPFLPEFYKNPQKFRFQTQLFFLLRRFQHCSEIVQMNLFRKVVIADYLFQKDRLFAGVNLDENEFWLYDQIFQILEQRIPNPDLVIFLQARTEVLMERIKMRGRKYEKGLSWEYLDTINQAFNEFFFHYSDSPLLVVDASDIDFVHIPEDLDDLIREIDGMGTGTQYYIPLSSRNKTGSN